MKYLVTGGAGFIGSHMVDDLLFYGHEVTVVDNMSTGKMENLKAVSGDLQLHFVEDDIRKFLDKKPDQHFDVIFHLAAMARIQPSFDDPVGTFESNATNTVVVLEHARRVGARVVYAGSSTFYYDTCANPYAFAKWIGEEALQLYHKVFKVRTAGARFFNVYGERQIEDGPYSTVVGIFERQHRDGEALTVTGTGEQRRDFTHVSDIIAGLRAIEKYLERARFSEPFNLGTGRNYSINEVAALFKPDEIKHLPKRPGEARSTCANIDHSCKTLGWEPRYILEDYVKKVIAG